MKRFLPLFLAVLLLLSACSAGNSENKTENASAGQNAGSSSASGEKPPVSDPAYLPEAFVDYAVSDGNWHIEVPGIRNADTEALQKINESLTANREYAEELYENRDGSVWMEWRSYLYQDENRIQILLLQNEYPSLGTDGTLMSWNYDRASDTDVYVQDKIAELGLDEETLLNAIQEAAREPVDLQGAFTAAYLITDDHTVNFYYSVPQTSLSGETWMVFYTVTCDTEASSCTACFGLRMP